MRNEANRGGNGARGATVELSCRDEHLINDREPLGGLNFGGRAEERRICFRGATAGEIVTSVGACVERNFRALSRARGETFDATGASEGRVEGGSKGGNTRRYNVILDSSEGVCEGRTRG